MGKKSKRNKNKQQKSNGNRAQRTGQTNLNRGFNSYVELPPPTEEMFPLLSQDLADQVADVLLSPHRRHGLVPRLRDKDALSSYLQDVFCVNAQLAFLFVERLLNGLVDEEGDSINWRKQINDESSLYEEISTVGVNYGLPVNDCRLDVLLWQASDQKNIKKHLTRIIINQ